MNKKFFVLLSLFFFLSSCAPSKQIQLGDQRVKEENWDEAFAIYKEEARKHPGDKNLQEKMAKVRIKAAGLHYLKGQELLKSKNFVAAVSEFKKAIVFDPEKIEYQTAIIQATRYKESEDHFQAASKLIGAGHLDESIEELEKGLALNPENNKIKEELVKLNVLKESSKEEGADLSLKSTQPITLKFHNARLKEVFELLSKTAGINILFDKDVRDDNVTIFVKDGTFKETLNLILATNSLFMKRISEDTILIIPKTKQKVDQYQDLMIRVFYLSNTKAKQMGDILRTMLEIRKIQVNEELNSITIRETPDKVKLAEKIIEANDLKVGEVMLELEVLEVDRTDLETYGLSFSSNRVSANLVGNTFSGTTQGYTSGLIDLYTLKNLNDNVFQFIIPTINLDFLKTDSNAKILSNPKIRILDGKTAKINIGQRVPILLSSTTGVAAPGTAITPTTATNTEFKDTGIKVTAEPAIHLNNEISLKLGLEVSSLGDQVDLGQGIKQFTFNQRIAETYLSLRDGDTAVIGGLVSDEDRKSKSTIPGLGDIPGLGLLFTGVNNQKVKTEVLLTITPHILRGLDTPSKDLQAFWSGTEESYSTKPLFAEFPTVGDVRRDLETPGTPPLPPTPASPKSPDQPASAPAPDTSGGGSMQFSPSSAQIFESQETNIDLVVNNVKDITEVNVSFSYDPSLLDLKHATEGGFLKSDGKQTSFVASVNAASGQVNIRLLRVGDGEGVNGNGTIATLTFLGKNKGDAFIAGKEGKFLNSSKTPVSVSLGSGVIKVQ
ncbi:MAG: secretin N-terminal domain-containing protein [Nitrospiria bacterium]